MPRFPLLVAVVALLAGQASARAASEPGECPVSKTVRADAPRDPNADPFREALWYINDDKSIWAHAGGWGKMYWVRPQGTDLVITGRRLDGSAAPLQAYIPCCYTSGFQIVGLTFPTGGCWEVTAKSGENALRFVTRVVQRRN
jgi:hypothetical protein